MKKFFCSLLLCSLAAAANAVILDFESPQIDCTIYRYVGSKYTPKAEGMTAERSALKPYGGRFSLELDCRRSDATHHVNKIIPRPAEKGGVRLKFRYFIAEGDAGNRVRGRIMEIDAKGKAIRPLHFFTASAAKGVWLTCEKTVFPKPECRKLQMTLWFSGKMRCYLDDVEFGASPEGARTEARAGVLADNASGIWFALPADRKPSFTGVPALREKQEVLRFRGVRGGKTALILAVAPKKAFKRLEVEFSGPAGSEKLFSSHVLDFIELKTPDNPAMKGFHGDPLLPEGFISGTPGRNSCFYAEFALPRNIPSGVIKGVMTLKGDGVPLASLPCEVTVRNIQLPEHPRFKTYMPIRAHKGFRAFDPRPAAVIVDEMLEHCRRERINPQGGVEIPAPKFEIVNGLPVAADWSRFDAAMEKLAVKCGFDRVRLPLPTFGANAGWFLQKGRKEPVFLGEPLFSGKGLKYLAEVARLYSERLEKKYPGVIGYAFLYDEPPAQLTKEVRQLFAAVHEVAPRCRIYVTGGFGQQYLDTAFAFCIPLAPGHLWSEADRAKIRDRELWYYNWNAPLDNISYQLNRLYPWLCYAADGGGALAWHSNNTGPLNAPVNPWTGMEKTYGCGAVTVFYPPRHKGEGVVSSLRMRHRGLALDDYDCMKMLEERIDKSFPGAGRKRVMEILAEVIPEPPFKWLNEPDKICAVRERLEDELESFDAAPVALLNSNPAENTFLYLPEIGFTLRAEPRTNIVLPDGRKVVTESSGKARFTCRLPRLGLNKLQFTLEKGGKRKTIFRQFTLLPDPVLKELEQRAVSPEDKGFVRKCRSSVYTAELRREAAARLLAIKQADLRKKLDSARQLTGALSRALVKQAESCFAWQLPERAGYYLDLAFRAKEAPANAAVTVRPFVDREHFGVELDNGIVAARFLETGGRLVSFRVRGVETFAQPAWKGVLPPKVRAQQNPPPEMVVRLPEYGGMEDASGGNNRWLISAVDWNMDLVELSGKRAVVAFSSKLPGTPFVIRRAATLEAGSAEIRFDYTIRNTAPRELQSDDPASFQLSWRLRLLPGIGKDGAARDRITVDAQSPLPCVRMGEKTGTFYSRVFPLKSPRIGAFDAGEKTGFLLQGNPEALSYAYIWFDDCARNPEKKPLYTLEVLRSFLKQPQGQKGGNRPFTIPQGTELNFQVFLRGLSGPEAK